MVWFLLLLMVSAFVLAGTAAWGWMLGQGAVFDRDDMRVVRRPVAKEENGFHRVTLGPGAVFWPMDAATADRACRVIRGARFDERLAAEILRRNENPLQRFDESLVSQGFVFPPLRRQNAWLSTAVEWNQLARVVVVRALYSLHRKNHDAAVRDLLKLMRFGQRVEQAQGSLLHWTTGSRIKRTAMSSMQQVLPMLDLPPDRLVEIAGELSRFKPDLLGLADAYRWEYGFLNGQIDSLTRSKITPMELGLVLEAELSNSWHEPDNFDPHHTHQVLVGCTLLAIRGLGKEQVELPELFRQLSELRARTQARKRNPVGILFLKQVMSKGVLIPLQQVQMENVYLVMTRTMLAMRAYQKRRGQLPQKLEELVPEFLDSLPMDPHDGQPLRYLPERQVLYSVGEDQQDEGGSDRKDVDQARSDRLEPTFPVSF